MSTATARSRLPMAVLGLLTVSGWLVMAELGLSVACPLKSVSGWECAFCGATRATLALLGGHVGRAIELNLLYTVVVLPAGALTLAVWAGPQRWRSGVLAACQRLPRPRFTVQVVCALLVLWTVTRNVPALSWLAAG